MLAGRKGVFVFGVGIRDRKNLPPEVGHALTRSAALPSNLERNPNLNIKPQHVLD